MSRFRNFAQIMDGAVPADFGVARVAGSSLTIPGQGCDLAQIIASIVKLPPLDERTFDVPASKEPDLRKLAVKTDLEALYTPEGVALAEQAQERRKAAKQAREASKEKETPTKEEPTPTE